MVKKNSKIGNILKKYDLKSDRIRSYTGIKFKNENLHNDFCLEYIEKND